MLTGKYSSREDIVPATKLFWPMHGGPGGSGLSRKAVLERADASLRRLGTEHIDLLQIHRFDPQTPAEETMEALHEIVKAGKVRYLGASSMWARRFSKMQHAAELSGWTKFISMQDRYSLIQREEEFEMFGLLASQGVGSIPWSPLGGGKVTRPWVSRARPVRVRIPASTASAAPSGSTATKRSSTLCSGLLQRGEFRWPRSRWHGYSKNPSLAPRS
ncbi:aldo/keto reductase [Micrococcaceae bacterium Sec5.7]